MINKLECDIEKRAEKAECLNFCKGIKLLKIKDTIASMLNIIGTNEIFDQYTVHDISHVNEMLRIAEWLIPNSTKEKMTDAEWLMLTLAIYLHDLGMVVSKNEFEQREMNENFREFKKNILSSATLEYKNFIANEKNLYQEFVRKFHAVRIREWIENKDPSRFGFAVDQCEMLNDVLSNLLKKFKTDLGMICESHHKDDLDDFNKYKIISRYGNEKQSVVNLNYIAIILRCADLLHMTNDRTPSIERRLIDITNPISILEWEKQQAVTAVAPQLKRNAEGNIDVEVEKDTIEITANFYGADTAEAYFGLSSYLQYVRKELLICNKISQVAIKREGSQYNFPWKNIDECNIITEGFEAKKLEFTIEQDNILKLLVGHTLYNDSSVVVRELTQNAIDAIKLQSLIDSESKNGEIIIEWNSHERILSFSDNGTGMTISDIENYFLKVGASKYRQKLFQDSYKDFSPISRFGIGILTCFMVANDIDVETNPTDEDHVNLLCLRNVNGKYLLKKTVSEQASQHIREHGTIIKLHIRPDVAMDNLEENLKKWIVVSEIPIYLIIDDEKMKIGSASLKEALTTFLMEENYKVDNKNIKIEEKKIGNVTIACALRFNKYISDWSFLYTSHFEARFKNMPIGTCVEGIRVEFTSPGYKNSSILSLANITGSKFQTNVARSALEYDSNNETLKSIYDCYKLFVEDQILDLEKQNYSKSWALNESLFLMGPLLDRNEPIDKELLVNSLSDIKILFVEKEGKRENLSINDLQKIEKFDILDCKMINAIESLFREFSTDITISKMFETVLKIEGRISDNPLITNFCEHNEIHCHAITNRQVCNIKVDTSIRKIQLTYTNKNIIWKEYNIGSEFRDNHPSRKINIPINDFKIEGLSDEIGVKTIGGIYLNSDSELCKYIKRIIKVFEQSEGKENHLLLNAFLGFVFNSNFLEHSYEEKDFDYMIRRVTQGRYDEEILSQMWDKIDVSEFKKVVLLNNYILFSLDNWMRSSEIYI